MIVQLGRHLQPLVLHDLAGLHVVPCPQVLLGNTAAVVVVGVAAEYSCLTSKYLLRLERVVV